MIEVDSARTVQNRRLLPRSPLVGAVVNGLIDRIRHGEFRQGDRLPTIRRLADQHTVSYSTVQLAVAHLEKIGLVERIQGSGTYVRQQARPIESAEHKSSLETATTCATLFLDHRSYLVAIFNNELIGQCRDRGVLAMAASSQPPVFLPQFETLCRFWRLQPPQAVVLNMVEKVRDEVIRSVLPERTRMISIFRSSESTPPGWHTVNPDYARAYYLAAKHLIDKGHRRIGLVSKYRILASNWRHTERKAWMLETRQITGAGQAMREAGIDHGLSIHYNRPVRGDPSGMPIDPHNVERMMQWLSQDDRPTAIITDDYRVAGVRQAAKRLGLRIPDDLQLMPIGGMLSYHGCMDGGVDLCHDQIALQVANLITAKDEELGGSARQVLVPPKLIEPAD